MVPTNSVLLTEILWQPGFLAQDFDISASAFGADIFFCRIFIFHVEYRIYSIYGDREDVDDVADTM